MSTTVTEFPQLAHTESSNTNSVRTGSEPRLTHLQESGSQRSSEKNKQTNALLKTATNKSKGCKETLKIIGYYHS